MRAILFAAALAASAISTSAAAATFVFQALLDGPSEAPPNASPGTGFAQLTWDTVAHSANLQVTFSGLVGTTTASHIHGATAAANTGTAGVATQTPTFSGFPLGVTSGTYNNTFDTADAAFYNPSYVTAQGGVAGAEAALLLALQQERAYLNLHTNVFPGGEIRGFFPAVVPEPATWAMLIGGCALAGAHLRRRQAALAG